MDRKTDLLRLLDGIDVNSKTVLLPLIDEVVFLEGQLEALKKLPFLKVHPQNQELQKATPAAKQYKELLQQYTNVIKVLSNASGTDITDEESPLRKWVKEHVT